MSPPCDGRDGMETAFIRRCKPHPFEPRALRGRFPRLETRGGLFLGHSRSFEKLSGSLHNAEPLGMSGARRALGGLRPRASRERRLQPEELTGHALRLRSFRPQQPDLPRWEGAVVRGNLPWIVPFPSLPPQPHGGLWKNKECHRSRGGSERGRSGNGETAPCPPHSRARA